MVIFFSKVRFMGRIDAGELGVWLLGMSIRLPSI
jgi:hypothetical protein